MVWGGGGTWTCGPLAGRDYEQYSTRRPWRTWHQLRLCTSQKPESTWVACFCHTSKAGFSVFGNKRQMLQEELFEEKALIRVQGIVMKTVKHHQ